ncbi:MAG: Gfo/Idh/MocA family oxidoreductase [Fretibacterium sp.]|nr:Gfo/Idh/MocA family oxidoreductase [Fretibacterium sp.]
MEEIRLGALGSGTIVHSILDNVARTDGIRLEAVCSRSAERGAALAAQYGAEKAYTDLDALLSDEAVNTVYIATPNLLHYEQARRALLAGRHVICEKPFVTRLSQAKELAALAAERRLFLVEAAPTMFLPNFRILRRELPRIGRVRLVLSNYSQYSSRYDAVLKGERPNIFNPEYAGGCLMDINFYNVLLNVALFGRPEEAVYYPNLYPGLADTSGVMLMRYRGHVSQNAGAKDTWGVNFFQIEGEGGYLYVEDGSNGIKKVRTVTRTSDEVFNSQPDPDRWFYEIQELTRMMLADDRDALASHLNVTLDTVAVIEEARKGAGLLFPGDEGFRGACSPELP